MMRYIKYIFALMIVSSVLSFMLSTCGFEDEHFSEIEVGKNFYHTRDGHCKKLPHNYCLDIELGSTARLYKVDDEYLDIPFGGDEYHSAVYNASETIIEGHYIKGYFNDEYIVLCEEKDDGVYYLSLAFSSVEVAYYGSADEVYKEFGFDASQWFTVCNTIVEISASH